MSTEIQPTAPAADKPVHTLILDAGPIIKNAPSVSSLLAQSEDLLTVPSIISEIRDAATRSRVETTLLPFLKMRTPSEASYKFVHDFARKTGDAAVLSRVDLQIAALAYEVECERNGGDWRLRNAPGQKRVNGAPPKPEDQVATASLAEPDADAAPPLDKQDDSLNTNPAEKPADEAIKIDESQADVGETAIKTSAPVCKPSYASAMQSVTKQDDEISTRLAATSLTSHEAAQPKDEAVPVDSAQATPEDSPETESDDAESDGGEWITPSNLKRKQNADKTSATTTGPPAKMQIATLTTDNALQNLLLQINLNLLSPSLSRITHLRTTLLRCHACFLLHRQPDLTFCQRCGKPSLTRVTCTTQANGEFKIHLKKNMQWNNRGDKYSIPKPVHGSANGRGVKGGGKNGWGQGLVLAEDQKEFVRAEEGRKKEERKVGRGLMDEDYLPGILTGRREGRTGGRTKVGAGRNVNARKR